MLLRLLLFFVLAYLLVLLLNSLFFGRRKKNVDSAGSGRVEEMVLDPQCKSYIPKSEAVYRGGHYFCSKQCAKLFQSHET